MSASVLVVAQISMVLLTSYDLFPAVTPQGYQGRSPRLVKLAKHNSPLVALVAATKAEAL